LKLRSKRTYLVDENIKMSGDDIHSMKSCKIINSTDIFRKGEPDETLTEMAKIKGWVIVTKDIRMALRSLMDKVPVIFISDDFQCATYLTAKSYGRKKFPEMFDYIHRRFGYN